MKTIVKILIGLLIAINSFAAQAQRDKSKYESSNDAKKIEKKIPDILGFQTLLCDFHMHTIFSDGKVWPTIRVQEALKEGLDVIALTDHIGKIKPINDVNRNLDRAYEIAIEEAKGTDLIVIKGGEISFSAPHGHNNALFLSEAQKLETGDPKSSFEEAKKQDPFFFWNHSNWRSPNAKWEQDGIAIWGETQDELIEKGMLMGLEVVNAHNYNKEAHQWCIDKNLTMFANSDIHNPITFDYDLENSHRPTTLIFAEERSIDGVREALEDRRTVVWYDNMLIGNAEFLEPIFQNAIQIKKVMYLEKIGGVILKNNSAVDFILESKDDYSFFTHTKIITINAGEEIKLGVKTGEILDQFELKFRVLNMLVSPENYLETSIVCKTKKK